MSVISRTQTITQTAERPVLILRLRDVSAQVSDLMNRMRSEISPDQTSSEMIARYEIILNQLTDANPREHDQIAKNLAELFADLVAHNNVFSSYQNEVLGLLEHLLPREVSALIFLQTAISKGEEKKVTEVAMKNLRLAEEEESEASVKRAEDLAKRKSLVRTRQIDASLKLNKAEEQEIQKQEARFRALEEETRTINEESAIFAARILALREMQALMLESLKKPAKK